MRRSLISLITVFILGIVISLPSMVGATSLKELQDDHLKLTIVYSTVDHAPSSQVRKLDLLLNHFTSHVTITSASDLTSRDLVNTTHLVYYGETAEILPDVARETMHGFDGPLIVIGENSEQFQALEDMSISGHIQVHGLSRELNNDEPTELKTLQRLIHVTESKNMTTLLYGHKGSHEVPIIVQQDDTAFIAATELSGELKYHLADIFHDLIPNNHVNEHLAYLKLEDVHPLSDPEHLRNIGDYLNTRNIPFIISVTPVYISPETGKRVHFSESPELRDVLIELQKTGASLIARGYTHQSQTKGIGEGYEFWDSENNQFIYKNNSGEKVESIKERSDFPSKVAYRTYLEDLQAREATYVKGKLTDAIHELTSYGLYPLAFEPPNHIMSQHGYALTKDHFTGLLGQAILGESYLDPVGDVPYISSASYLSDLVLYPETIGFVDSEANRPMESIETNINQQRLVRDGVIGGTYHTYLGMDYLPDLIELYESVPRLRWLDLKQEVSEVKTEYVTIQTDGTGEVIVTEDISWFDAFLLELEVTTLEIVLWIMTFIVFIFVLIFLSFTVYLRLNLRKRLFDERSQR